MASTYTSNIRLEKQADGENPNSWGALLNTNVIDLVDQAVAAYQIVSVSGTTPLTLSQINGTTDQSRKAILSFDGTLTAETSIIIPSVNKMYYIRNNTSGAYALKVKTVGNTAITIEQGSNIMVATDGTNVYKTAFPTSVSSFTANSLTATSVSTSVLNATKITTSIVSATNIHATSVSAVSGRFSGTVSASAFDGLGNQLNFGSDAQGDILYNNGTNIQNLPAGTSGQFLKTQGSSANPVWATAGGLVQAVHTQSGAVSTGSTALPLDDTIPVDNEGVEFSGLDTTITPTNSSNKLLIEVNVNVAANGPSYIGVVLFQDGVGDGAVSAVAGQVQYQSESGVSNQIYLSYEMVAGTTSATTFHVRSGTPGGNSMTFNGTGGTTRLYGGVMASTMRISEITV